MNRKQKIEHLKSLASGRLTPGDLLLLLPTRTELFIQDDNGLYHGEGFCLTETEMADYKSPHPGRSHQVIIENPHIQTKIAGI